MGAGPPGTVLGTPGMASSAVTSHILANMLYVICYMFAILNVFRHIHDIYFVLYVNDM